MVLGNGRIMEGFFGKNGSFMITILTDKKDEKLRKG